ncbi:acyl carrier protein [Novosphingobium sp. SG707]|uniref:acyl carrier protein n=1 Tax=Novosphingobium sp. SG707 TaxID=2586996 RepID=UPI0017D16739|nr:acyl carrier protein [Novosphingobium sp. SG707]NKJ00244.1 acyl carrier protein [Novosphingobium sp. SG707]
MDRYAVIDKLMEVFADTFDDDEIAYRDDLTAADVAEWDSLSNIRFMVAVEQAFGRKFSIGDWQNLKQLGDLVNLLAV